MELSLDQENGMYTATSQTKIWDEERGLWVGTYHMEQRDYNSKEKSWHNTLKASLTVESEDIIVLTEILDKNFIAYMDSINWDLSNDIGSPYLIVEEKEQ